jgi:hypothetical protein
MRKGKKICPEGCPPRLNCLVAILQSPFAMNSTAQSHPRTAKIAETPEEIAFVHQHLQEVLASAAFRGSHRSAQFLKHIVEQSIAGRFESLKERSIGIELFGRAPAYDTGEDAIVRVTASDVRKRLLQHYGTHGTSSEARLVLPLGSYVPELRRDFPVPENIAAAPSEPVVTIAELPPPITETRPALKWAALGILLVGLNVLVWGLFWRHSLTKATDSVAILPWSTLLRNGGSIKVVTSDPNIEKIERLSGEPISLSDYANQQYIPNPGALSPEIVRFCKDFLRGDLAPAVDIGVVAKIAALAQTSSGTIDVQGARDLRLSEVYTDDNFIFLGSPRSNRWAGLFNNQLDFRFDLNAGQEIIRDVHPRSDEKSVYVPTAGGYATGQSFATISFLPNPGKNGHVLLLAGANGEGTRAAGELITNKQRLSTELQNCGIKPTGSVRYFQLLLGLDTMAGSPSDVKVIACHVLPGGAT